MYTLQELIEKGYIDSVITNGTPVGDSYTIIVKLSRYSISKITIDIGIDEYLDDAVRLINGIVDFQEELGKEVKKAPKLPTPTDEQIEELKDLLSGTEIKDIKE